MAAAAAAAAARASDDDALPARFQACVQRVRDTAVTLSDGQRLELYGLFKQATEGDNGGKQPGLLDFVGRSKWSAWMALAGLDAAAAMQQYVDRVAAWLPPPGPEEGEASSADAAAGGCGSGGGGELSFGTASVSTMGAIGLDGRVVEKGAAGRGQGEEEEAQDVFYFAKRGMVDEVAKLLEGGGVSVDAQDEEGRSLLHWACDGGHFILVEWLLGRGCTISLLDSEGETALGYAELCEYEEIAARLKQAMQERG